MLPSQPPSMLTGKKRLSQGLIVAICPRNPKILPAVPITRATVLVALAVTGAVPNSSSTGKVIIVPPPATALMSPAAMAARARQMISVGDMRPRMFAREAPGASLH